MRPFEKIGTYTTFPNEVLDIIMPNCKPNTWKVVCVTVRKTLGWHKREDTISLSQYQELTGIKGRGTLISALRDAVDEGYITKLEDTYINTYHLNLEYETSAEIEGGSAEIVPESSAEIVPTKDSLKDIKSLTSSPSPKEKKKEVNLYVLAMERLELAFASARSNIIHLPSWGTQAQAKASMTLWRNPCKEIWEMCDKNTTVAESYIHHATKQMMNDNLTVSTPRSILEVCKSLILDGAVVSEGSAGAVDENTGGSW